MIRFFLTIPLLLLLLSCNAENDSDCFKSAGSTITESYLLDNFSKVIFHEGIQLEIEQGDANNIQITYGRNLIDNITTKITDGTLSITNTTCNLLRGIEPSKVIITAINISEIRNASQFKVFSNEVLRFDTLTLISEDYLLDAVNVGDFELIVDNQNLNIITNNVSNFYINGNTNNLDIIFAAGLGKFEGEFLNAQNIHIFHRGINTIVVNPIQKLTGEIRGEGNIVSVNRPPIVDIVEFYTGQLIFRD